MRTLVAVVAILAAMLGSAGAGLPSARDLYRLCPKSEDCATAAARGYCVGETGRAMRKQCKCACDHYTRRRYHDCCAMASQGSHPQCYEFCRYDVKPKVFKSMLGYTCAPYVDELWYCGWEGGAGRQCCLDSRVPTECLFLCEAEPPCNKLSRKYVVQHAHCFKHVKKIHRCMQEQLGLTPRWDADWRTTC